MASTLNLPSDCCPVACDEVLVENIPGPSGEAGTNGEDGAAGVNAYTVTTASFIVPAVNSNVTIAVQDGSFLGNGQKIFIQFAGYYEVQSVPSSTSVIVKNLGYDGNAAPAVVIPTLTTVSPGGIKGADGSLTGTAGGDLEGTYPNARLAITTTKGDLIVNQNAAVAPRNTRLSVGADGRILHARSAQATGLQWSQIDLSGILTSLVNELPVANGGTGSATAAGARTNLAAAKSGANSDITELTGLTTDLTVAQGGTGASTAQDARTNLGKLLPRYGMLAMATAVDLNAVADTELTIEATRYRIDKLTLEGASAIASTAQTGLYTLAGGGGTEIVAVAINAALTAAGKYDDATLAAVAGTDTFTNATLQFRVGVVQGGAATANVFLFGWRYD